MTTSVVDRQRCPYVGLQPFEEADCEFFFGRERDQRIIISNLLAAPLTILYGSSGVGKSSVLMAGVVPQLRREREGIPVIVFSSWADKTFQATLIRACIDVVWSKDVDQPRPAESLPFDEVLRACGEAAHGTVLVLLDQFEEYFLYHPKSTDPDSFEAQFARAVNREDVNVGFLIALREDALAKLDRFRERIPNLLSNRLRLDHLDTAGAVAAIRNPLCVWNETHAASSPPVGIEDELVDELIRQVRVGHVSAGRHGGSGAAQSEDGSIEAPFLQLVMVRLWDEEMRAGSHALRRETLDRLNGATEIVRTHLDEVMARLEAADQAVCASFFDRLVTPTGSKVACSMEDLARWAGDLGPRVPKVLKSLSRDRILRTVAVPDHPDSTRYEIFHDVLAPAILDWRRSFVEVHERALAVEQAREAAARHALRQWLVILWTITVVAVTGLGFATWAESRSRQYETALRALNALPNNPDKGLMLALKSVEATLFGIPLSIATRLGFPPRPAAEDALRQAMQASRLEWTLRAEGWVHDIAFSPDGRMLAAAGDDKKVKIWYVTPGEMPTTRGVLRHEQDVFDVGFLPSGNRLVTAAGSKAYLWSLNNLAEPLKSFDQGGPIYSAFALSLDGTRLATASGEPGTQRTIKVWDLDAPGHQTAPIATLDAKGSWVMGLAFSPDGDFLASASSKRGGLPSTAGIWRIESKRQILPLPITAASDAIEFTPDGNALISASRDAQVRVWERRGEGFARLLARSRDAAKPGLYDSEANEESAWRELILSGHGDRVRNVTVSRDGSRIASAGADNAVKIWDTRTGENLLTLIGHTGSVEAVKFSPDGSHVATASRDKTVRLWSVEGHTKGVTSIAFSPDGKTLATGSSDRTARLWDLSGDTPRQSRLLRGHTDQIYRIAFNAQGTLLATAGFDNSVKLWEVQTGAEVRTLKEHTDQLRGVAFSPDGERLASVGDDGMACFYGRLEADPICAPHSKEGSQATAVAFHPRQSQWATSGDDGSLKLWDFDGKALGTLPVPADALSSNRFTDIAFNPEGTMIAALARRWVYLWPVTAFDNPPSESKPSITIEGAGYCQSIAYSPDGTRLAVACNDGGVRIYETATFELVKTITVHKSAVSDVVFSPDGRRLATASLDKTFHVSPLRFDELYQAAKRRWDVTSSGKQGRPQ